MSCRLIICNTALNFLTVIWVQLGISGHGFHYKRNEKAAAFRLEVNWLYMEILKMANK